MITCRELVDLLLDYLHDELPPEQRARCEDHLKKCPPCIVYLETYQITIKLTRRLPCTPPPPELMERLRTLVQAGGFDDQVTR